jgi:signal transduction histidine kinase
MKTRAAKAKTVMTALSLRMRLLLMILALALPVAVSLWSFLLAQRAMLVASAQTQLQSTARSVADDIDDKVRGAMQLVTGLAYMPLLDNGSREECSRFLAPLLQRYSQYTGLASFQPDGTLKCDATLAARTFSIKDRPYFERGWQAQEPFAAEAQIGRGSGLAVLPVLHSARDAAGNFRFLLVAAINLDAITRELPHLQLPSSAVVEIWSAQGTLLARNEGAKDLLGKKYPDSGVSGLVQGTINDNVTGTTETTGITGVLRVWAVAVPAETSEAALRVAVGLPKEALLAPARSALVNTSIWFALVLLGALALAWWLAERWIDKPIKQLALAAGKIQAGQLDARVGGPYGRDEIGAVSRQFDQAAAAVEQLTTSLEQRVADRTAALATKNDELKGFAYTVSHDLKAPLRGISGYAQELERRHKEGLSERALFCIAQINVATKNLEQLIEDLLTYSRLESELPTLTEVPLPELVQGILRDRSHTLAKLGVEVCVEVPPMTLHTWQRGLHQVLSNLIDNALKYSCNAKPPRLRIAAEAMPGGWRISVSDNGIGFDMKYHDRIFGLFNRLVRASEFEGTGAGLAIVKKLIDKLGGSIRAESAPGAGATFIVELPAASGVADSSQAKEPAS